MPSTSSRGRALLAALLGASALVAAGSAFAQEAPVQTQAASVQTPSQSATVNLIRALVAKGVLGQAEAEAMIAQAEQEAAQARGLAAASPASATPGTSVRYVPDFVRDQIKDEVKQEVLADAKTQGLVAPDAVPEWVRGVKLTGDFRFRDEGRFFDAGNALDFVNVGAINSGSAFNTDPGTNPNNPPIINSRKDRNYLRIRARLGLEADIDQDLTAYFRIATGSQNNPVSTNQTLGGSFSNKDLWLDRAYVDFRPTQGAHVDLGRMPNPFRLTELVWDEDVNLDGAAASYERPIRGGLSGFAALGAFPLDYGADDGPTTGVASLKTPSSKNKWLIAGQLGASWKATDSVKADLELAYYGYQGVTGALSPACSNLAAFCLTDYSRPGFSQRGNTLFALRDITTTDPTNGASPQYYGLASKFQVLAVSGALDWAFDERLHLNVAGHYARNLGYDRSEVLARGFNPASGLSQIANNNETCGTDLAGGLCPAGQSLFKSGNVAWLIRASLGMPTVEKLGDWSLTASYRRIEPDALLDAFTDSDFHLGGTNAKGWTVGGVYGLRRNTSIGLRWLNSEEISGPPFKVDLLQADLNVKF